MKSCCKEAMEVTSANNSHKPGLTINKILAFPFIAIIKIYQWIISPLLGPKCRFTPTCSHYALEAFRKFGPFKGFWLALKRILRCHPWGGHGFDPVP